MKNIFKLFFGLAVLVFFFSCKNSFDLVKRHYNHGFYVANSHHANNAKKSAEKNSLIPVEKEIPAIVKKSEPKKQEIEKPAENKNSELSILSYAKEKDKNEKPARQIKHGKDEKNNQPIIVQARNDVQKKTERDLPAGAAMSDKAMLILYILLAIIIPPLAVYVKQDKVTKWFWITLILWLLGGGLFFGVAFLGGAWFVAFIIALLVVLDILS